MRKNSLNVINAIDQEKIAILAANCVPMHVSDGDVCHGNENNFEILKR